MNKLLKKIFGKKSTNEPSDYDSFSEQFYEIIDEFKKEIESLTQQYTESTKLISYLESNWNVLSYKYKLDLYAIQNQINDFTIPKEKYAFSSQKESSEWAIFGELQINNAIHVYKSIRKNRERIFKFINDAVKSKKIDFISMLIDLALADMPKDWKYVGSNLIIPPNKKLDNEEQINKIFYTKLLDIKEFIFKKFGSIYKGTEFANIQLLNKKIEFVLNYFESNKFSKVILNKELIEEYLTKGNNITSGSS